MDKTSLENIKLLHPKLQEEATTILNLANRALTGRAQVRFGSTYRSPKEQDGLYELGRTKVNPDGKSKQRPLGYKVTNAPGWSSIHQYRLALDILLIVDGKEASWDDLKDFDGDKVADWMEVVKIFKSYGWVWGGDWSSIIDKPHFQKTFGLSLRDLQAMRIANKFIPGTNIIQIGSTSPKQSTTTTGLNLRNAASSTARVLVVVPKGTPLVELSRSGSWVKVEFGKLTGWVSNAYLN